MDSLKDAYELLEHTAKGDLLSEKLWKSNKVQSLKNFFVNRSRNNEFFLYRDTQSETYDCVADLMSDFIRQYPAPPVCRQKLWDSCNRWLKRIACELNISNERPFSEYLDRPCETDFGIELIKKLHPSEGISKEELAEALGVTTKTIQTSLRAIDSSLIAGEAHAPKPLRIGGQEIHAHIRCTTDPHNGKKYYCTPERVHPIALQLNTFELGTLFQALYLLNSTEESSLSLEIAIDVWGQLSETARSRILEIFGARNAGLCDFLGNCTSLADFESLPVFRSELEQFDVYSLSEQVMGAFKGSRVCNLKLCFDGEIKSLKNQRVLIEDGIWYAIPNEEFPSREHAIEFEVSNLKSFIELKDW